MPQIRKGGGGILYFYVIFGQALHNGYLVGYLWSLLLTQIVHFLIIEGAIVYHLSRPTPIIFMLHLAKHVVVYIL